MVTIDQSTTTKTRGDISAKHLKLHVKFEFVPFFFSLLGHGFTINVLTGCSIKDLLCKQLGIHEDYLAERITTIFLNAKVVDDVNTAIVNERATLALSGAMPGLVGAVLRSGGFYAAMRSQISHTKNQISDKQESTKITLKLLNLVAKELGPEFLCQGILIKGQILREFMDRHTEDLRAGFISGDLDGKPIELNNLREIDWKPNLVFLKISSKQAT